ncbi:MAG: 2-oxo acid dehydrogenase subunit E2 [Rhodanobacteraceae bacterium]|nr:2-oxo acid dehydrogenase subunit E2 [Rhodanobacteraceae bacterium]
MSTIKTFFLPDLGEGLPDATIVEWAVKEGEIVRLDAPLVSMETAKAVVEVPSPFSGKVVKRHGDNGAIIITGAALIDIELDPSLPQRAEAQDTGHHHGPPPAAQAATATSNASSEAAPRADAGTVVGAMEASDRVVAEQAVSVGGVKAMPAVRALAKKLGVDLGRVVPSGAGGVVTMNDVKDAANKSSAATVPAPTPAPAIAAAAPATSTAPQRTAVSAAGQPMRTAPPSATAALGQPEPLKGVRRNMARVMADAHAKVVPTTLCDDADLHAWLPGNDITVRLLRALVRACKAVPALNAWFDGDNLTRTLHPHVDVGIAVDTEDGLFVPALRNADVLDAAGLRQAVNRLRDSVRNRSIPAEELKGYTISLSNFGVFAGRYATPVVVPPCVAIVAAGKLRHELVPVMGGVETHRLMPLSLTFDHRAATGGEAARFLKALLDDLGLAS